MILIVAVIGVLVALLIGFGIIRPIYAPPESEPDTVLDSSVKADKTQDDTIIISPTDEDTGKDIGDTTILSEEQIPEKENNQVKKGMTYRPTSKP